MKIRLSTRHLLALVAGAAIVLGLVAWMGRRAAALRVVADWHAARATSHRVRAGSLAGGFSWWNLKGEAVPRDSPLKFPSPARDDWHAALKAKYERAARHPWLPVAPDPPEPE